MTLYERIINETQMENFMANRGLYAMGGSPIKMSSKLAAPYNEQIENLVKQIKEADVIIVGGASGLSAAGGGDFYYENNDSYKKYFGKYEKKYGFKGAFAGTFAHWNKREEFWGYLITFLHTTINAEVRKPYLDLDKLIKNKEFFILTTNQDTQFVKLYPESKVAEIQGDHRFFQCSKACCDMTWDSVDIVNSLYDEMGDSLEIPKNLIPRCPVCGAEAFPWVRGYGNFLTETKYNREYAKISDFLEKNMNKKILFLELGVGRMTPMFIQEPFWQLTKKLENSYYISINNKYDFLPEAIEDRGMVILDDIAKVLEDAAAAR